MAKNFIIFGAYVKSYERKKLSPNGNPRFSAVLVDISGKEWEVTTGTDCSVAYGLTNYASSGLTEPRRANFIAHYTASGNIIITRDELCLSVQEYSAYIKKTCKFLEKRLITLEEAINQLNSRLKYVYCPEREPYIALKALAILKLAETISDNKYDIAPGLDNLIDNY